MKKIKALIALAIIALSFSACDNEVDTTADWEDITIVYGLLNQNDSVSYIKITKAFLGDGNALTYAQVQDSSEYPNKLDVKIEEYYNGNYVKSIDFDTTTIYNKEEGIFYSGAQQVYSAVTKEMLSDDNTYKLVIHNPENGETISGETNLVNDNFIIKKPLINNAARPTINILDNEYTKAVQVLSTVNGRRYSVFLTFDYEEVFEGSDIPVKKSIVWHSFPTRVSSDANGNEELDFDFLTHSFWQWIETTVPYEDDAIENTIVERYAGQVTFTFEVAEEKFNTYMEINEPTTSIVQERPEYTNIENGLGLFSARYSKDLSFHLSEISSNILWGDYIYLKFVNPVNK